MARVPAITERDQLAPEFRDVYDEIAASRGSVRGPFPVLLHSPEAARRIAHLGTFLRFQSSLDDYTRELAILTVTRVVECDYEFTAHSAILRSAGASEDTIQAVASGAPGRLSASDREVYELVVAILDKHRIAPDQFQRALERFGSTGLVELLSAAGYYAMLACVLNGFEVHP